MANITVTYTFTNGTTASATEVNTNFTDIINGLSNGSKDISVSLLTVASTATFNGAVVLGNASGDDISMSGRFASDFISKTTNTYDLGSSSLLWKRLYLGTGIVGTTTNDDAGSGIVGEILGPISRARASSTSLTNNTAVNVGTTTSITLTAGDWDVSGVVGFLPANSTTVTELDAAISATSATLPSNQTIALPTAGEVWVTLGHPFTGNGNDVTLTIPTYRVSVATTQTLYLVARGSFGASTLSVYGWMMARRAR